MKKRFMRFQRAAPYTYPFRIAQRMNSDYINLGFAGSALIEKVMAEYIVSGKDRDLLR